MPYKSEAQRKYFHVMEQQKKIKPSVVKEFDKASKGKSLPDKVTKTPWAPKER